MSHIKCGYNVLIGSYLLIGKSLVVSKCSDCINEPEYLKQMNGERPKMPNILLGVRPTRTLTHFSNTWTSSALSSEIGGMHNPSYHSSSPL